MGNTPLADELWTVDRLAEYLGVGRRFIYRLTHERRIAHIKIGGSLRFTTEAIAEFLENETVASQGPPSTRPDQRPPRNRRRPRRTETAA